MAKLPCVVESGYAQLTLSLAVQPSPSAMSKEGSVVSVMISSTLCEKALCQSSYPSPSCSLSPIQRGRSNLTPIQTFIPYKQVSGYQKIGGQGSISSCLGTTVGLNHS